MIIRQVNKALVEIFQLGWLENVPKIAATSRQGVSSTVLSQNDFAFRNAGTQWLYDFVGGALLEEAILVDSAFVSEGIGSDYGFVGCGPKLINPASSSLQE